MEIAINEAKGKLSALINAALKGEKILLTKHGKPVAEIKPLTGFISVAEKKKALVGILTSSKAKKTSGASAATADHFLYDETGMPL